MELCKGITLKTWLESKNRKINQKEILLMFKQMVKGVL